MSSLFRPQPSLPLGTHGPLWWRRVLRLPLHQAAAHAHVIGVSGSGKSRFLAGFYLSLLRRGLPATMIDPHGDLAKLVLAHLVAAGTYRSHDAYERILYLDIPSAERADRFLPFNCLAQPLPPHAIAANVMEAFHRAWPSLAFGAAPRFDKLVLNGVKLLISNGLPLPHLERVLIDQHFRDQLLEHEADGDVVAVWRDWYDRLPDKLRMDVADSTLTRINLLTFAPALKYSLGQADSALNFRQLLDRRQSLIINLALDNPEAQRLLGCLLTVAAEQGAISRLTLPSRDRSGSHHLILDEFSQFSAQSEEALARMLSQTRKAGLFLVMAHQTWSQASERLRGALQNVGLEAVFRLGRSDAEHSARILGRVDPRTVRQTLNPDESETAGMAEQWEGWVQAIQELPPRHAFIKPALGPVTRVQTLAVPDPPVNPDELAAVEERYLTQSFRPVAAIAQDLGRGQSAGRRPAPTLTEPL